MKKNVFILGAGPAGLTAGYELIHRLSSNYSVTIIEKSPYVGGLCRTIETERFLFDIGGHRYFTSDKGIEEWWKRFFTEENFNVVQRSSHIVYQGKKFSYPIALSWQEMRTLGFQTVCNIAFDYIKTKLYPMSIDSLEDFYISHFGKKLYHMFFEAYTEKVCGLHPSSISPEWGYHRVGELSISKLLTNRFNNRKNKPSDMRTIADHFYYPKLGAGDLWERVSKEFVRLGGHLILNDSVQSFCSNENTIYSLKLHSGCELSADYVISSIPIHELLSLIPGVPRSIVAYGDALSYRDIVVVSLLFQYDSITGDLKSSGEIIPDQWLYIQDEDRKVSRIQLLNNWSKSLIKETVCVGLSLEFFTSQKDEFADLSDDDLIKLALSELLCLGYIEGGSLPIEQAVFRQEKAYPCYYGAYDNICDIRQYINTIRNLSCIGRNGQHHYSNVDHVMETAFRAVNWVTGKCEKESIWLLDKTSQ